MTQQFTDYITSHSLWKPQDKLLVAVSGGVDSVVLCELLYRCKFNFAIAHCNFGLRNLDSDLDENFVKQLADKYEASFYTIKFDTLKYSKERKVSTQMAARELRYDWFEILLKKENFKYLLSAHHLNDNVETVLLNLTKGTGIAGITGMQPKHNNIVRPLLFATKEMIVQYAQRNELTWREDVSNGSNKYQRNLLRNKVIPLLKQINPSLEQTFYSTLEKLNITSAFLQSAIDSVRNNCMKMDENGVVGINFEQLKKASGLEIVLLEMIKTYGFDWTCVKQIVAHDFVGSKEFYSSTHYMICYSNFFRIKKISGNIEKTQSEILIDRECGSVSYEEITITLSTYEIGDFILEKNPNIIYLDLDKVAFPLTIRNWEAGDVLKPFGLKGKKKVSDLLIDMKVPLDLKSDIKVLTMGNEILWVIGIRASCHAKMDSNTKQVLKLELTQSKL